MAAEKIDLSDIDMSSVPTLSAGADAVNPDIAAVFPEPLPESDPKQDFFAAAAPEVAGPDQKTSVAKSTNPAPPGGPNGDSDAQRDRRTEARASGGVAPMSNRKKKKAASKKGSAAAAKASKVMAAAEQETSDEKEELTGPAAKRAELREKLRSKMAIQKDLGGKSKILNQMGVTMNEIGEAARDEASGKHVKSSKQEAVLNKATNMFARTFKGMDPKQRSFLSRKTEEMSGMATNLMKKMLSGPGKDPDGHAMPKKKKIGKGVGDAPAAPTAAPRADSNAAALEAAAFGDSSDAKELDATLDPRAEDMIRAVHEKKPKQRRPRADEEESGEPDDRRKQLPIRPRAHATPTEDGKQTGEPSKNQLKNKRKRQKLKEKLKLLKTTAQPSSNDPGAAATPSPAPSVKPPVKPEEVPLLVPA